jgi:hypothetical protein
VLKRWGQGNCAPGEAGAFQWVQIPRGQSLASSPLLKPLRINVAVTKLMKPTAWSLELPGRNQVNVVSLENVVSRRPTV